MGAAATATAGELAKVRARHPAWVIRMLGDGTYRAMREWFGSQQIVRVASLAELDATLAGIR